MFYWKEEKKMNSIDGDLLEFISSIVAEKFQPAFNIKRNNKAFYYSDNFFIKVVSSDYIGDLSIQIGKVNRGLSACLFFDEIKVYRFKNNLIQVTPRLQTLYEEFGCGEYDSTRYFFEKLIDENYIYKIKNISREIWCRGFIHLDIIKSLGVCRRSGNIKLYDCECIMDIETYKTTLKNPEEIKSFFYDMDYHDRLFLTRLKELF